MMPPEREFQTSSELNNLKEIAHFIAETAEQAELTQQETFEVQMAVDEACTNIMQHAYKERPGDILILVRYSRRRFTVTIVDHGRPFDPTRVPLPDVNAPLKQRQMGGLGIFFMHRMMNEIRFEFDEHAGNRLTMVKHIIGRGNPG